MGMRRHAPCTHKITLVYLFILRCNKHFKLFVKRVALQQFDVSY